MVRLLKSFYLIHGFENIKNFKPRVELPMMSFNKMCYGFVQNDWCLFFSALVTFLFTIGYSLFSMSGKYW